MKLLYYYLNMFFLPITTIYICYVNVIEGRWETAFLLALLSVFSIGNYLQAYGEPNKRAEEQNYQDQFINQALRKCKVLENEIHNLQNQIAELT